MKHDIVKSIFVFSLAGLIAFGFFNFYSGKYNYIIGIGSFVMLLLSLFFSISVSFQNTRTTILTRTISLIFFPDFLTSNIIFFNIEFTVSAYVIASCVEVLLFLLLVYSIKKAKQ